MESLSILNWVKISEERDIKMIKLKILHCLLIIDR